MLATRLQESVAFMHPQTHAHIRSKGISVWLKAELPILLDRIEWKRIAERPVLKAGNLSA